MQSASPYSARAAEAAAFGEVVLWTPQAAWMAEVLADTFRQAMATSPAGWRQAVVFTDLT